jgi:hypothetical protein
MPRKDRKIVVYRHIIVETKRRLPDPDLRFNENAAIPMRLVCLQRLPSPTLDEAIRSDYGVSSGASVKAVTEDFWKEIQTIEQCIKDSDLKVHLAIWQKGADPQAVDRIFEGLNLRAYALQMWDWFAIPLRYRDHKVFAIWAPRDALGTPIIQAYDTGSFLKQSVWNQVQEAENRKILERNLRIWMTIGTLLIIFIGLMTCRWVF